MVERGDMRSDEKQLVSYRDLRWGKITPTDLDGFLDFGNKIFVLIEYKYKTTPLDGGQEKALKRLVDSTRQPACLIHATHDKPADQVIDGANAIVVRTYFGGCWFPDNRRTVKQVIDAFRAKYGVL